ncbi:hypothetical protein CLV78_109172 [Aliiruegeria haliotis]|uniref:Uncharacterized protein n=1 Tax=Aliiruegeria haliotis TaxID=1280846 RepID=A0A2T0RK55_9RHOB|nr:hypothetical protein [Aliiruegeria haliotis]PRY21559.1 hypothetical protein CLV78_109172 [Aliiruegeria haliotis]
MDLLIWIGASVSILGLIGLVWCMLDVVRARREGLDDDAMRQRLQKAVTWNLAALFVSAFGLMMVIVGIFLT